MRQLWVSCTWATDQVDVWKWARRKRWAVLLDWLIRKGSPVHDLDVWSAL